MSQTIENTTIVDLLQRSTLEVLSTMLGIEALPHRAHTETRTSAEFEGVISFIGMAGQWIGNGSLHCGTEVACQLASKFLMSDYAGVNEEVLDAIGELTNMIMGSFKNEVEQYTGPMGLSIPTVIHGRNFSACVLGNEEWTVAPFECGGGTMYLRLCLKPNDRGARLYQGAEKRQFVLQP